MRAILLDRPTGLPHADRGRGRLRRQLRRLHRRPAGEHVPPPVLLPLPPPLLPRRDGARRRRLPHTGQGKSTHQVLSTDPDVDDVHLLGHQDILSIHHRSFIR